jgi:hypothetical protein
MPWRCPACQNVIRHAEEQPRAGVFYRCEVCHLELVADIVTGRLVLLPSTREDHPKK